MRPAAHHKGQGPAPPPRAARRYALSLLPYGSALCLGTAPSAAYAAMPFHVADLLDEASLAGPSPSASDPSLIRTAAPVPAAQQAPAFAPSPSITHSAFHSQLPSAPPPIVAAPSSANQSPPDGILFLELILNGRPTQDIIQVEFHQGRLSLLPQDLQKHGVQLHVNGERLHLADIPNASFEYQVAEQRLALILPDDLLPHHIIGNRRKRLAITPADTAFLLNYDAFISTSLDKSQPQMSLYLEPRITSNFGVISSTGLWRNGPYGGYKRYDSSFRTAHANTATIWEVGDFITRNLADASAVRLGGIQISRDFAVRPDIITYPMPRFSGRAALPSTVELLVDGRTVLQQQVDPGQFLLDNLPLGSGSGTAQLIVTDLHGQATTAHMPFYVSSNLLASGLTDFAVSAGFFRENYALKNFSYGDFAASGSLRHGLSDAITGELRAEASRHFWLLGSGIKSRLATWGVLSAAAAFSRYQGQSGHHISVGYDYQAGAVSVALRHMRQSSFYRDMGRLGDITAATARQQSIAGFNLSMGRSGNIGLNYTEYKDEGRRTARYANFNYSLPVSSRSQIYAQMGRDFGTKGWHASLAFSLSLSGRAGSIGAGIADQSHGPRSYRLDYSRSVPSDNGLGWNVGANITEDGNKAWRADMQLRTRPAQFRFGGTGTQSSHGYSHQNLWLGASGGLVFIDGMLVASNQLPNSFAVVSTNGFADIPVRYEHQPIGRTNKDGKLFISNLVPWYDGLISIDPLDLPADVTVHQVEQRLAVEGGRGVHVRFPIAKTQPLLASLRMASGEPVPAGSAVLIDNHVITHIGWDGLLYLEDIAAAPKGLLDIQTPDQIQCQIRLSVTNLTPDNWNLGEIPCAAY